MPESKLKPIFISPNVDLRELRKAVSDGYTATSATVLDLIDFAIRQLTSDSVETIDGVPIQELYGRMIEDCDIEMAIESGQFKTIEDVYTAVKARSECINQQLLGVGVFKPARRTIDYSSGDAIVVSIN